MPRQRPFTALEGANGVILITTRQGSSDNKTRVELYANFRIQEAVREYDMLNSADYTYLRYKAGWKYYPYGTSPSSFEEGTVYRDNPNGDGNYWVLPDGSPYENWQAYNPPRQRQHPVAGSHVPESHLSGIPHQCLRRQ